MTTQTTSIKAFKDGMADGAIPTQQQQILRACLDSPFPLTAREAGAAVNIDPRNSSSAQNFLRRIGVLSFGPKRKCAVTGKEAHVLVPNENAKDWLYGLIDLEPAPARIDHLNRILVAARRVNKANPRINPDEWVESHEALKKAVAALDALMPTVKPEVKS